MKLNGNPLAASAAAAILLLAPSLGPGTARGNPPSDPRPPREAPPGAVAKENVDEPEASEYRRMRERRLFLEALDRSLASGGKASVPLAGGPSVLGKSGTDRVLVLLVEFAGTDTFTWTQGTSTWDPLGKADTAEAVYDSSGNLKVGDCSKIITSTRTFNYSGPLHNRIPRPLSASDRSGDTIWTPDFSAAYYDGIAFGNGWVFDYTRQDGSKVHEDFTGKSVSRYFQDLSGGAYQLVGDVYGWLPLAHSTWWYGADPCPGARSSISSSPNSGGIPGAGTARTLVKDALEALKAAQPDFDYKKYDQNGDGVIDRLWIIHAGYGEEDSAPLLNATDYSEASIWSHSSSVSPAYEVAPGIKAGPYIMMPENAGIGVLAHEFAHNIGASDLYSYGQGETSAGFWTLMADDWTGYPIGFQPPALDPYHLDLWGWLDPEVIVDPAKAVTVTLGQASAFPGGAGVRRGARIRLADGTRPLPVTPPPPGTMQWWGGMDNLLNASMTLKTPLRIPAAGATLGFQLVWDIEEGWDFLWVQASPDGGKTWTTLTNGATSCNHDSGWIGGSYGFPSDLCSAGIGGFTGTGPGFPAWTTQSMDLARLAGKEVLLRF